MASNDRHKPDQKQAPGKVEMPGGEQLPAELGSAKRIDDFFGREGIFARVLSKTRAHMLEAELSAHLGYEGYEAKLATGGMGRTNAACAAAQAERANSSQKSCTSMNRPAPNWRLSW